MPGLITAPNLPDADAVFERLVRLHDGRTEAESLALWAKLVLTLANHIGDRTVIEEAIAVAAAAPAHTDKGQDKVAPPTGARQT